MPLSPCMKGTVLACVVLAGCKTATGGACDIVSAGESMAQPSLCDSTYDASRRCRRPTRLWAGPIAQQCHISGVRTRGGI